jgi:hypothetical protein
MPASTDKKPPTKKFVPKPFLVGRLKKYSLKELETLAVELYEKYFKAKLCLEGGDWPPHKKDILKRINTTPSLDDILSERQYRLNHAFKWTPKTIARFLEVNKLLADTLQKAFHEARPLLLEIEERIKNKDSFLHDYEMEIQLHPYIGKSGALYEMMAEMTGYSRGGGLTRCQWNIHDYYGDNARERDSLDHLNFNTDSGLHHKEFEKHHICYAMHELCDHSRLWSFPDILKITSIWIDVKVWFQHSTDRSHF